MAVSYEKRENGSLRIRQQCEGESKTEQSHRDVVNINSIMRRYQKTGVVPQASSGAIYGDFTGVSDYRSALEAVRQADEAFMKLPSSVRKEFGHDPQRLLAFLSDPNNRQAAEDMGLIERAPEAPPQAPPAPAEEPAVTA